MESTGAIAAIATLLVITAVFALIARRRSHHITRFTQQPSQHSSANITVLQFSTEMCGRCPSVARMIRTETDNLSNVKFELIDLNSNIAAANTHNIRRTPTVLFIDAEGNTLSRLDGAITAETFRAELSHQAGVTA